jgi:hypothetical protein
VISGLADLESTTCSRASCRKDATKRVSWRNPKIHAADRVKVWLACSDHEGYLENYLATRSFPVKVTELWEEVAADELGIVSS